MVDIPVLIKFHFVLQQLRNTPLILSPDHFRINMIVHLPCFLSQTVPSQPLDILRIHAGPVKMSREKVPEAMRR